MLFLADNIGRAKIIDVAHVSSLACYKIEKRSQLEAKTTDMLPINKVLTRFTGIIFDGLLLVSILHWSVLLFRVVLLEYIGGVS